MYVLFGSFGGSPSNGVSSMFEVYFQLWWHGAAPPVRYASIVDIKQTYIFRVRCDKKRIFLEISNQYFPYQKEEKTLW